MNLKDFGDSIPGHGGIADRMDCQLLMGVFAYLYYANCANFLSGCICFPVTDFFFFFFLSDVRVFNPAVLLERIYSLPLAAQQKIYQELGTYLAGKV